MLILGTLAVQSMHGYGIAQHIQRLSREVLRIEEGSLYPALQRMRQKGWIKAQWGQTPEQPARAVLHDHAARATTAWATGSRVRRADGRDRARDAAGLRSPTARRA